MHKPPLTARILTYATALIDDATKWLTKHQHPYPTPCPGCNGQGRRNTLARDLHTGQIIELIPEHRCSECNGTGTQ